MFKKLSVLIVAAISFSSSAAITATHMNSSTPASLAGMEVCWVDQGGNIDCGWLPPRP